MQTGTSSPNKKSSQPLKKRKIEIQDESNDDSNVHMKSLETVNTNSKCISNENEEVVAQTADVKNSPEKKNNINEHSQISNNNQNLDSSNLLAKLGTNEENTNIAKDNNNSEKLTNGTQNSLISVCKIEKLRSTPKKNETIDTKDIKVENTNSPQIFSSTLNTNSVEWNSNTAKSLLETPTPKKIKHYLEENNTPISRKKRKISNDIGDSDQLSDVLKSEMYDTGLNDMEQIDMLHDLDFVMDFEDTKITTEFLSSTAVNEQNEHNMELSKDLQIDPLFIADNDENVALENVENKKFKKMSRTKVTLKKRKKKEQNVRKPIKREHRNNIKSESNNEEDNETYNFIKSILGELNIQTDTETGELSEDSEESLYNLEVQLTHKVPPQHKIERSAGSRSLTELERKLFLKYGPIRKGVFSPNEDKIIKNNWETFCKIHNWNPQNTEPFRILKNGNKFYIRSTEERQKFVQFLANGLPWRTLYSVYQRFKKLYEERKKRFLRYTPSEDEKILTYLNKRLKQRKRNTRFADLAKILGRPSHSVWLRYQLLKKMQQNQTRKPLTQVKWTLPLIGKFIKELMNLTLCEKIKDLKDATIPKPVWVKLEEKLNINHDVLKLFWMHQLHMQLFCPEPIYMNDIKIKLIEYVYGKGFANTREIIWPNVVKYFEGVTSVFLCKVFFYLVQETIMKISSKNLPDIVEYLYRKKIQDIRNELTDKFLPRLLYKNGKVSIVDKCN
ncbi:uncharacterized protein LOC143177499 [Calliopsis andreniformis]|uniref:uncharacterized protein LOC143177499 n=1 Tax=Calliopsis andreniformis TaxID=337506 RepID=UPI003FCDCA39